MADGSQAPSVTEMTMAIRMARWEPVLFAERILRLKRQANEPQPGQPGYNPDLDWEMDEWQKELLESVADVHRKRLGIPTRYNHDGKPQITCAACQGPGKTFGISVLAHVWGFAYDPIVIPVMAPKKQHVKTRFFGEFAKITQRAIPGYSSLLEIQSEHVYWKKTDHTTHFLIAETGQQPENIQGLRRRFTLSLVDESSGVSERLFPVLEGNMSGADVGVLVLIGNPTKNIGTFADSHLKAKLAQDYYRMQIGPGKSKRIKQSWIDRMERKYGAQSPVVRIRCYGEFAGDGDNQLISMKWISNARNRDVNIIVGDGSTPKYRISVDCGAGGTGETVCTLVKRFTSIRIGMRQTRHSFPLETASNDTADAAERLFKEFALDKDRDDFVVDALGVGVGAAGELRKRGYRVVFYQGGSASDDAQKWRCRRVQSYINARNDLRDGGVVFADDFFSEETDWDDFEAQLCSIQHPDGDKVDDLITKKEMKEKGLESPDMADSWAMQYATQAPSAIPGEMSAPADKIVITESAVMEEF